MNRKYLILIALIIMVGLSLFYTAALQRGRVSVTAPGSGSPAPSSSPAWVIYMDGQSNNLGRGLITDLPAHLKLPLNAVNTGGGNVYIWANRRWQILEAGVNQMGYALYSNGALDHSTDHGAEMELGYRLANTYKKDIYIIKAGRGGRPLHANTTIEDFHPDTSGELHNYFKNIVTDAHNNLLANNLSPVPKGWFWMQGEYDCRDGQTEAANAYNTNLTAKISAVRTFLNTTQLPAILGRINSNIPRNAQLIPIVQNAQVNVTTADSYAEYINTDTFALLADGLHFSSTGQISLGNQYFQKFKLFEPVPVGTN